MNDIKLSLGCGREKREGFIGLDISDFGWNKVCDIATEKYPFEDSSVGFIEFHNTLEHIERKYWKHVFNECWRILKPHANIEIIVPDASKSIALAVQDPTHVSFVVMGTFTQYLAGGRPRNADYGFKKWDMVEGRWYIEKEPRDLFVVMAPRK